MNKNEFSDADEALQKLTELLEKGEFIAFDKNEAKALKEVANAWSNAKGFVFVAGSIGSALKWFVGLGVAWAAFKLGFFGWLSEGLRK